VQLIDVGEAEDGRNPGFAMILGLILLSAAGTIYFFYPDILWENGKVVVGMLIMSAFWAYARERRLINQAKSRHPVNKKK